MFTPLTALEQCRHAPNHFPMLVRSRARMASQADYLITLREGMHVALALHQPDSQFPIDLTFAVLTVSLGAQHQSFIQTLPKEPANSQLNTDRTNVSMYESPPHPLKDDHTAQLEHCLEMGQLLLKEFGLQRLGNRHMPLSISNRYKRVLHKRIHLLSGRLLNAFLQRQACWDILMDKYMALRHDWLSRMASPQAQHPYREAFESSIVQREDLARQADYKIDVKQAARIQLHDHGYEGEHLVVIVHGYRGRAYDMCRLRHRLSRLCGKSEFLISTCNQGSTGLSISEMGALLAEEVKSFVTRGCLLPQKISFVGHSMGGLIIRAALGSLGELSSRLDLFISLASAHSGVFLSTVKQATLSLYNSIVQCQTLKEMLLKDEQSPADCFLSTLSRKSTFALFQQVVLVAAVEDGYVPLTSALATGPDAISARIRAELQQVRTAVVEVSFQGGDEISIDSIIGRAPHIRLIQNCNYLEAIFNKLSKV